MENQQNRKMLLETIVHYGDTISHEIVMNIDDLDSSESSNWSDSSSNSSRSDMDVDEEVKKPAKLSKQEENNRLKFLELYHQSSKYPNPSKMYQSRKLTWSERKISDNYYHYKAYNSFPEDLRSRSRSPLQILNAEQLRYIISEIEMNGSLSTRKISKLLEERFQIKISKTKISQALKENGYKYKSPKLKVKNEEKQQAVRKNWWLRHLFSTNFHDIFFSDETTFYLDNPVGSLWLKDEENIIYSKNKGRKIGAWAAINVKGKTSIFLYEENLNCEHYLEILIESVIEMKEIDESDIIQLQFDNAKYH